MSLHPPSERSLLGSSLASRYELRALLGRGGMGEVYEAVDRQLNRTVAVKILHPELAADRRFPARFRREARTVASLSHPGIVAVHDIGEDEEQMFIVMELVAGRTLGDLIRADAPVDPGRVARIGMGAAQALAHAHSRGVVHRDVAPGNLMVTANDEVKVLDFGIARAARGSSRPGSGTTRGTIAYVAPEQLRGQSPDHRADIYGLGAVMYELVTGEAPFHGGSADEIAELVRWQCPVPPDEVIPGIPRRLSEAIEGCLAKDPDRRVANAGELTEQLWRAALAAPEPQASRGRGVAAMPPDGRTAPVPVLRTRPLPVTGVDTAEVETAGGDTRALPTPVDEPPKRRRIGRALAGVAMAIVTLAAALLAAPSIASMGASVTPRVEGPEPLGVPQDVEAAASCDGFMSTGVDLSWTPGGQAGGYEIWRRGGTARDPKLVASIEDPSATTYRDVDLAVDTTYSYRVRAVDEPRVSRASRETIVATPLLCLS